MGQESFSLEMIKNMAQKIDFVSFDMVKTSQMELRSHWYHYDHVDLYYFEKQCGEIVKIHISVFGQVIDWNIYDGVQTGLLIEEEVCDQSTQELVQYDARPNPSTLAQGFLILENAFNIEARIREELAAMLLTRPRLKRSLWQRVSRYLLKKIQRN